MYHIVSYTLAYTLAIESSYDMDLGDDQSNSKQVFPAKCTPYGAVYVYVYYWKRQIHGLGA